MIDIKHPPCYDVSHWKEIENFTGIVPRPVFFITKATEAHPGVGYYHTDEKFERYYLGAQEIGATRGSYHFFRNIFNAYRQAEHYISVVSRLDVLPTDWMILDMEEVGTKASQMWAWFYTVRNAFPGNPVALYSRKGLLDAIYMTESEKAYFRDIPIWTAGYPDYPNLINYIPLGYTPDQSKYGEPILWQYSSHGRVTGITTEIGTPTDVDLNLVTNKLYQRIGDTTLGETVMASYTGTVKTTPAKLFDVPGGRDIGQVGPVGTNIRSDIEQTVSGIKYIHIVSPKVGWSKAQWYNLTPVVVEPPPPPDPEPTEDLVEVYINGVKKVSVVGKATIYTG